MKSDLNASILLSVTADLGWFPKLRLFLFGTSRFYKLGAPITNLKAIQNKDLKWIKRPKVVFNVRV